MISGKRPEKHDQPGRLNDDEIRWWSRVILSLIVVALVALSVFAMASALYLLRQIGL